MKYTDKQRLEKIMNTGEKLLDYLEGNQIQKEQLLNDYALQWLVTTPLYNIGEHVYNLSNELKTKYENIPWVRISGLRHRLVHNYDDVNWNIIVDSVYDDLPQFLNQIRQEVLPDMDE